MDFHAFHHNITTDLANLPDVKGAWVDEITAQESAERRSESSRYTKAIRPQNLKAVLDRIILPVDMSHLRYAGQRGKQAPGASQEISFFAELAERETRKKIGKE